MQNLTTLSRTYRCLVKLKHFVCCPSRPLTFCYLANKRSCRWYGTSIYVSDKHPKRYFEFDHDLDEKLKDIESLKKLCERRGCDVDIDMLKVNYQKMLKLHEEKDELEQMRHDNAGRIAAIVKQKVKTPESENMKKMIIKRGKEIKNRFRDIQETLWELEQAVMEDALSLPNDLLPNVTNEEEIVETYLEGQEIMTDIDHTNFVESQSDVVFSSVGQRAYYLRGKLAVLEQDLIGKFSAELRRRGMICMLAPEIFTTPVVEAGCIDVTDPKTIYRKKIKHVDPERELDWQLDNTFLHGASHLSFIAHFARMVIDTSTPDSQWFVVGRNYKASDDENLPGLFGVLQSVKVCMCSVNVEETKSLVAMEMFKTILTDVYKQFNVPYRIVSLPIESLSAMEMNRMELQMWVPSLRKYLKIASVSYCGDYSSRRLMTRCSDQMNLEDTKPVFMVHSEVTDITRLVAILMENNKLSSFY